jgi:quercetin dioxygenase-like cupin family protein
MIRAAGIFMFLLAALPLLSFSEPAPIDALTASPGNFKLLLENEHVRVLEYTLAPGQRDEWHTHPPKVSYVVSGGKVRVTTEDGKSFLADEEAGTASWMGALGRHFVENVGSTTVRVVLTEVKCATEPRP